MSEHPISEPVDVLHVASFVGNIGDNANHNGTRKKLRDNLGLRFNFEEIEIRKYYQNYSKDDALSFDQSFVNKANKKDLVLIGGGSFFDIWLEQSATGTTIDISNKQIDAIHTPIIFHGLGCIPGEQVADSTISKFRSFLDHLFRSDDILVSVRNDGSQEHIKKTVGESYAKRIFTIPDGAFFIETDDISHPEIPKNKTVIGINVASDMPTRRFPSTGGYLSYEEFINQFSSFTDKLLNKFSEIHLIFIPHIYSDITAISDILSEMDIMYRRNRVTTAPYLHGMGCEKYIFDIYDKVDATMGLRLHSNICPIGIQTPSIGLANGHPKVNDLYDGLGLSDRIVAVHEQQFTKKLIRTVEQTLDDSATIEERYAEISQNLEQDLDEFHSKIKYILQAHN